MRLGLLKQLPTKQFSLFQRRIDIQHLSCNWQNNPFVKRQMLNVHLKGHDCSY